jgi:hypothetical protein
MNWYIAKLVFNILDNGSENSSQFDEQLRMIQAENQAQAFALAQLLGKNEESEMAKDGFQKVKWKFINVVELNEIPELKSGIEIYSRVHEAEQSTEYIKFAHFKSKTIQSNTLIESLTF